MGKTKYQCRSHKNAVLMLNGKQLDRVHAYKYLEMYIGYNKTAKNADLRHIEALCQARLQPLRALSCSGCGVGIPVLRMMYVSTVRSVIDYAAPCLYIWGMGKLNRIDLIQNECMRIVLRCQQNAMIDVMRLALNLPSVCDRVMGLVLKSVVKCLSGGDLSYVFNELMCNRSKSVFVRNVKEHVVKYNVSELICPSQVWPSGVSPL